MLWGEITPKNHVICVKSAHNLLYFIPQSDADNTVISVRLQHRMIRSEGIEAIKWLRASAGVVLQMHRKRVLSSIWCGRKVLKTRY